MLRLLVRLVLFLLPIFLGLAWLEWRLHRVPTRLHYKRQVLEERGPTARVVVLGTSHANGGIDPGEFPCAAINLANDAQTLDVDAALVRKFLPAMKEVAIVIVPVAFFSLDARLSRDDAANAWRFEAYRKEFGIELDAPWTPQLALRGTALAQFTPKGALELALRAFLPPPRDTDERGWTPTPIKPGMLGHEEALKRFRLHHDRRDGVNRRLLISKLAFILAATRDKGAKPVILIPPFTHEYVDAWPPSELTELNAVLNGLAATYGAVFADYSRNSHFSNADFADSDHLSPEGAKRFSALLANELIQNLRGCGRLPADDTRP